MTVSTYPQRTGSGAQWKDSTGNVLTRPDGQSALVGRGWDDTKPTAVRWLNLKSYNQWTLLTIPSPYAPAHVLHPSVVLFEGGWRGYRYWMAFTPYPASDSTYENPCVVVSNDGINWAAPTGLTNPIVPNPGGGGYNSDTDLAYDSANDRLVMVYRTAAGSVGKLWITTTSDGATWSTPVTIYTASGVATAAGTDLASPSLWYNDTSSKWEIVGHNIQDNASAWPFVKITSSSLTSGWDSSLTTLTFAVPSGRKWWHSQFRRLPGGAVVGVVQDNVGTLGSAGNLFVAYSEDGATFYYRKFDTPAGAGWYRPSFVLRQDRRTNKITAEVFGSKITTSGIYYQTCALDAGDFDEYNSAIRGALLACSSLGGFSDILMADTFNRADDATGLGTSTSGGVWTQIGGGSDKIGISSNAAYAATTGNCRVTFDTSVSDYVVRGIFSAMSTNGSYLMVRYSDGSNFIRIGRASASQLVFETVIAGSVTQTQLGITPSAGDEVRVVCAGAQFDIFLNGLYVATKYSTAQQTATKVGIQASGTGEKIDNFIATRVR